GGLALFEVNQPEVRVQDEDVRILANQSSINDLGFGERIRLEIHEPEQIQHVRVIGPQPLRGFQLLPRLGVAPFLKRLPPAVVVQEENTLIEWRHDCRRALGHVAAIVPWRRWSGGGFGRRFFARASAVEGGRRSTSSSRGTLRRAKVWPRSAGR